MKKLSAVALCAFIAFPSFAGNLTPVEVEPAPIVVEENAGSSVSPLLILGLLVLIGVLVSRNNDDDDQP